MGLHNKSAAMHLILDKVKALRKYTNWPIFAFDVSFPIAEQYDAIIPATIQDISIGGGCMLLIAILFMPNPISCICVTFMVLSINVGVIGFLGFWDVHLDIVALITNLLAIGISVDFCSHVSYHFVTSKVKTTTLKMAAALETVGWPIVQSRYKKFWVQEMALAWGGLELFKPSKPLLPPPPANRNH